MAGVARSLPKELLPVAGKPLLQWTLEEAAAADLRRAVVVTSPEKQARIAAHLAARPADRLTADIVVQSHPLGLGDAISCARAAAAGDDIAVLLPDNLFARGPAIAPVLDAARRGGCPAVLLARVGPADAATKGATGRVRTRPRPDGWLAVMDLALKGAKQAR